jgi:hypothetical protein
MDCERHAMRMESQSCVTSSSWSDLPGKRPFYKLWCVRPGRSCGCTVFTNSRESNHPSVAQPLPNVLGSQATGQVATVHQRESGHGYARFVVLCGRIQRVIPGSIALQSVFVVGTADSVRRGSSLAASLGGNFRTIRSSFAVQRIVCRLGGGFGFVGGFQCDSFRNLRRRPMAARLTPSASAAARGDLLRTTVSTAFVHWNCRTCRRSGKPSSNRRE